MKLMFSFGLIKIGITVNANFTILCSVRLLAGNKRLLFFKLEFSVPQFRGFLFQGQLFGPQFLLLPTKLYL